MGKKKDSVIITKEVSRYTNEELVLKKDSHVTSGNVNSRKTGSKRVDKEREREGEKEGGRERGRKAAREGERPVLSVIKK